MKILRFNEGFDPFKLRTFKFKVKIQFEGFDETILSAKVLIENEDEVGSSIEQRIKVFNNIVRYEIISVEEAHGTEKILPMY